MPPLARALVVGAAVLAVAAPAAAVVAHRDEADLTTSTAATTAVARADGFGLSCSADACTVAGGNDPFQLRVPETTSGIAIVTVTFTYVTTGRGRFGAVLFLSDGHIDHRRVSLAPAERRDTRTVMFRVTRLTPGQTLNGGLAGIARTSGGRQVSIAANHATVRVDYL